MPERAERARVAVFGAGGLGGYFGARLAQAGAEVHLIARGAHLAALQRHGLTVLSVTGDFKISLPATDSAASIGPVDYVLFSVKSFDTEAAAGGLAPLLADDTAVISFQNGIDNEDKIAAVIGERHVVGGAAFIFVNVAEPGVLRHTGGPGRLVFGELDGSETERAGRFLELCARAAIPAEMTSGIRSVLWSKFAFILAQAGMTAATRLPIGEIRETPESWEMFRRIIEEVCRTARAEGVQLPDDLVERHLEFGARLEPTGRSSLHHDLVTGHRMELDALHGELVRRARGRQVDAPMCEAVHAILKPWANRNEAGAATPVGAPTPAGS